MSGSLGGQPGSYYIPQPPLVHWVVSQVPIIYPNCVWFVGWSARLLLYTPTDPGLLGGQPGSYCRPQPIHLSRRYLNYHICFHLGICLVNLFFNSKHTTEKEYLTSLYFTYSLYKVALSTGENCGRAFIFMNGRFIFFLHISD